MYCYNIYVTVFGSSKSEKRVYSATWINGRVILVLWCYFSQQMCSLLYSVEQEEELSI